MNEKRLKGRIELYKHVRQVRLNLNRLIKKLIDRADHHDDSKFESPEAEIFEEHTEERNATVYGTPEYEACKAKVQIAIDHHYANNSHHPEFHKNGINGMNLLDLVEMLADWRAATQCNQNGNIRKSIEINAVKYKISPQLQEILENTVKECFGD
jgi:hypothetical protein